MDTSVWVGVITCVFLTILLRWLSKPQVKRPPGPIGLPFVGYLPFLSRKLYVDFGKLAEKYGNVFSLRLGSIYVVILNDFESTKEAFMNDAFIGRPRESPFDLNKESLDSEAFNGPPWMEHRKFSLHMLKDLGLGKTKMEVHILEEIEDLLLHLEKRTNQPFCICSILSPSMSNNIGSLMFGKRMKYDDPIRKMLTRTLNDTSIAVGKSILQIFYPWLRKTYRLLGIKDDVGKVQKEMRAWVKKEMEEHEKTLNPSNIRDFIDGYLIEIQKRKDDPSFCKPVLQDLVGAFFGAGSETVRVTVEWLLLTAASYPEAQRKVQQEIDDVFGREQLPGSSNQKAMFFTQAFISELMRWRTIIPVNLLRYTVADAKVKGYYIPKSTYVMSNFWAIHHDPEYWGPDADEFRPERFLTEDGRSVKKLEHFMPFSIGKRACPGEPFAKVEVFLYFTAILQRFNVSLPEGKVADFEGQVGIGLIPKPQELIFTKRD